MSQLFDGAQKLTVSEEWTDGINWFCACWCRFSKIKSWSKIYWVDMVKNSYSQSGYGTLKLTVSQNWADGINWFLHADTNSGKLKVDSFIFGGPCQKWQWLFSSWPWDPKISCIVRIYELSWYFNADSDAAVFLVIWISYSLTFKCWGSTAVLLLVFVDFQYLKTLVWICNWVIWVYFKVLKMTLRWTFSWNAPGVFMNAHSLHFTQSMFYSLLSCF